MKHIDPTTIQWPCELSASFKRDLLAIASPSNNLVLTSFKIQHQESGIFYIQQGTACVYLTTDEGRNINTMNGCILSQHDWVSTKVIAPDTRAQAHIETIEPVSLIYFSNDKIFKLCQDYPEGYKWLYHCSVAMQDTWLNAQITSMFDKTTRTAYTLLELMKSSTNLQGSVTQIKLSQKQLSNVTGLSRPRLNEVLKQFELSGEISIERGTIFVLDSTKLQARVDTKSKSK